MSVAVRPTQLSAHRVNSTSLQTPIVSRIAFNRTHLCKPRHLPTNDSPLVGDPMISGIRRLVQKANVFIKPVSGGPWSPIERMTLGGWDPEKSIPDMTGKVVFMTGGTSGMGLQVLRQLVKHNAKVYLAIRDLESPYTKKALDELMRDFPKANIVRLPCNLGSHKSTRECVDMFRRTNDRLDLLFHAGGVFVPGPFDTTEDGYEQTIGINYFGGVLLTLGLLDRLETSKPSRIVFVGSLVESIGKLDWNNLKGDKFNKSALIQYGTAKLFVLMFAQELQSRLRASGKAGIDVFGVHPGYVFSPMINKTDWKHYATGFVIFVLGRVLTTSPKVGCHSFLYGATNPDLQGEGWRYFGPNLLNLWPTAERMPVNWTAKDKPSRKRLYDETLAILADQLKLMNGEAAGLVTTDVGKDMARQKEAGKPVVGSRS